VHNGINLAILLVIAGKDNSKEFMDVCKYSFQMHLIRVSMSQSSNFELPVCDAISQGTCFLVAVDLFGMLAELDELKVYGNAATYFELCILFKDYDKAMLAGEHMISLKPDAW
jgi:hypothetical protein